MSNHTKHTVQVPLSFLLYFHELYLLSECHFFLNAQEWNQNASAEIVGHSVAIQELAVLYTKVFLHQKSRLEFTVPPT